MAGILERYAQAVNSSVNEVLDRAFCALGKLVEKSGVIETGTTGTARTLAYQYGRPPEVGTPNLAPRSMTDGPWVQEDTTTEPRVTLDKYATLGQYAYAGYIANIGENEYRAAWLLYNGSTSGMFSLPPGATVQVPCILKGVIIETVDGQAARYQVSLS